MLPRSSSHSCMKWVAFIVLIHLLCLKQLTTLVAPERKREKFSCLGLLTKNSSTFLWRVSNPVRRVNLRQPPTISSKPSYLFGTVHVPHTDVWPYMDTAVKEAFHSAHSVYFELDLTNADTQFDLSQCQLLPPGQRLAHHLPTELFAKLSQHLHLVREQLATEWTVASSSSTSSSSRLPSPSLASSKQQLQLLQAFHLLTQDWQRKRPVWILLMLNSLNRGALRSQTTPILDLYLAQEAKRLGKFVGAVEYVEEQCDPLNGVNLRQVIIALNHTLTISSREWKRSITSGKHDNVQMRPREVNMPQESQQRDATAPTRDLVHHYNCGALTSATFQKDTSDSLLFYQSPASAPSSRSGGTETLHLQLSEDEQRELRQMNTYLTQELIVQRNQRMAHRVAHMVERFSHFPFFFALGAGHFLGEENVVELLRRKGFQVEAVSRKDAVDHQSFFFGEDKATNPTNNQQPVASTAMNKPAEEPGLLNNIWRDLARPPVTTAPQSRFWRVENLWLRNVNVSPTNPQPATTEPPQSAHERTRENPDEAQNSPSSQRKTAPGNPAKSEQASNSGVMRSMRTVFEMISVMVMLCSYNLLWIQS